MEKVTNDNTRKKTSAGASTHATLALSALKRLPTSPWQQSHPVVVASLTFFCRSLRSDRRWVPLNNHTLFYQLRPNSLVKLHLTMSITLTHTTKISWSTRFLYLNWSSLCVAAICLVQEPSRFFFQCTSLSQSVAIHPWWNWSRQGDRFGWNMLHQECGLASCM